MTLKSNVLILLLYNSGVRLGLKKYPRLAMLAMGFLSIGASSSASKHLFSSRRGIVTYKRGKLAPKTISILMTLKWWDKKDETDNDEEESDKNAK